jgi:hypothetical protein
MPPADHVETAGIDTPGEPSAIPAHRWCDRFDPANDGSSSVHGGTRTVTIVLGPVALAAAAQHPNRRLTSIGSVRQGTW